MKTASFDTFDTTPEPEQITLTFGKHAGWPLGSIEAGYLEWVLKNADRCSAALRAAITKELATRATAPTDRHSLPSKYDEPTMDLARLIVEVGARELRECMGHDLKFTGAVEFLTRAVETEPTTDGTLAF